MTLHAGSEILSAVVENSADFIGICTPDMMPYYVNPAGLAMIGLQAEDVPKTRLLDYFWPDDRDLIENVAVPILISTGRWAGECRFRNFRTGEPIHTLWNAFVIRDFTGKPIAWATISPNLNRLRMAEQRAETEFRFLVDSMPQMVWTATPDGAQDFANNRWFEFTGMSPEAVRAKAYEAICHPDDLAATEEAWGRSIRTGEPYTIVHRVRRHDGQFRWILTRALARSDKQGNITRWFGTGTDITDLKLAQEALVRTEKLASVGRLAATVAHEINNPLEAVMNSVYIVRSDPRIPTDIQKYLELAEAELQRVAHITRQTLGFYRENAAATKFNLAELIDGVLELFGPRLRNKSIRIERRYGSIEPITATSGELRQVVSNLIGNSIDAVQQGGIIRITVKGYDDGVRHGIKLLVTDNGSGISPTAQAHLFEAFFTTKEAVGTGLGLWVSKGIVEKHKGRIMVRSIPGHATTFLVYLPL